MHTKGEQTTILQVFPLGRWILYLYTGEGFVQICLKELWMCNIQGVPTYLQLCLLPGVDTGHPLNNRLHPLCHLD